MTPEQVIQAQLEAYNARDINAFVGLHSPTAQLYDLPTGNLICEGETAIRERYTNRFQNDQLHATVVNRMVLGNRVIDHEEIVGMSPDRTVKAIAIYEIENALIQRVWFIFE